MADMMASSFQNISSLLEKMQSPDQDYRFMAISDMIVQIQKDTVKLDDETEQKVVRMLLKLLEDRNGEVQNIAVKCLGVLIKKIKHERVETIVMDLCKNAMSEKDRIRDISNIGLKTVISQLPLASGDLTRNICECIVIELVKAVKWDNVSIQFEALELLADLLNMFGNFVRSHHMFAILRAIIPKFCSPRQAVQKRSVAVCSVMVRFCDDVVYKEIINHMWNGLTINYSDSDIHTYIQCIFGICREAHQRFSSHIEEFLPMILQYSLKEDDDIRESCLLTLQIFIQKCPKEITTHLSEIISLCMDHLTYDPNYNYDYEDEIENKCNVCAINEDSDNYSDDDDTAWKVRRAAAKCLELLVTNRTEMLMEFYQILSPALITRFKERDENVKSDIFQTYAALLKQTNLSTRHLSASFLEKESPVIMLQEQAPHLIKAICEQMKQNSMKTRRDCFNLLRTLFDVFPEALNLYISDIIPGLLYCLNKQKSNNSVLLDTLSFIHYILGFHQVQALQPHINEIIPLILNTIDHDYYRITVEGLLVLQELIKAMRPLNASSICNYGLFIKDIYNCTFVRLKHSDIEVKEQAILTMAQIISNFADFLQKDLSVCLSLLLDRLRNDITRLTAIKAFAMIAMSPLRVELPVVNEAILILSSFLHQNQRILKVNTINLLDCLIRNYYDHINIDYLNHVIDELPVLLNELDLHIAQITLVLLKTIAQYHPSVLQGITEKIFPEIMKLLKSPLLQGTMLVAMQQFFQGLVKCHLQGLGYNDLLQILTNPILQMSDKKKNKNKHIYYTLSKCVAAITVVCRNHAFAVVNQFLQNINVGVSNSLCLFSLLVIGEIGREIDLTSINHLKDAILQSFLIDSEEVKIAASYALGCIALGNLQEYLPFIVQEIETQPDQQYLVLLSLQEVINSLSIPQENASELLGFIPEIWQQLLLHCQSPEEGIRGVISECLGKLTLMDPTRLLPELEEHVKNASPIMRAVVVLAIKYTIVEQDHPIDSFLRQNIGQFLNTLQDPDLNVRRASLMLFNSVAHNKLFLLEDLLDTILPLIYNETKVNEFLIQEVKMGPFKHTVDEGLDIRKAAFECMYTLLNKCIDFIDVYEFLNHIEAGLKDHYDIKMLTYLMVEHLAQLRPKEVLQEMDNIIQPLSATCTMKVSPRSVQQEFERLDELKKCAMRTLLALQKIPNIETNLSFNELLMQIKNSPDLTQIFESHSVQKNAH
ncbi:hypothetical protein ILUMI_26814 [Ignelater luminosus]|uniref:Cullin-associated NEDD8-dissociated protein 1 n=1 Tax=Ignelater luminosus TaxID=2038154 RepID=A0A8K0C7R7_IGNLU|nr:hypothetical protein ILUMI_26814 [Ignelater luminosus]